MSETTKNNLKTAAKVILTLVVVGLIISRCQKDEEILYQQHYEHGYEVGFDAGSDAAQTAAYMEFENAGLNSGYVEWAADVIISRYDGSSEHTDEDYEEAINILHSIYEFAPDIINSLEENNLEVELPNRK